ncbi:hypothetical protein CcaCcLH18_11998 [Colletotrichum camelliae]|nr:hypothetical protein CcaCcLH18_11998 [Colletotrichum camelliae]
MKITSNFWNPRLKAEFHQTIASLRQLTEIPSEPRDCRGGVMTGSRGHTLSIEDEIRMADSVAFLAHHEEGGKFVSTVTLRECPEGLQVVLAGNTTPSSSIIDGLMRLTARLSGPNQTVQELLDIVLRFSSTRVLGRLRPPWVEQPRHFKTPLPSLQNRLQKCILEIGEPQQSPEKIAPLLARLKGLVDTLNLAEHPIKTDALRNALKTIIISCSQVARLGNTNSVEEHLKSVGVKLQLAESPEIRQVDKLARYFFTCRDLARVARKPDYRRVFRNIDVRALNSPAGVHRPGTAHYCFVHAEIQQIFHLEQHPHTPAPRAIGCSKSACYLCDLFIRRHGRYVISHTHGRLYDKWTLPDAGWMTATQMNRFQMLVQSMTKDMREAVEGLQNRGRTIYRYPLESRACLPLSSGANSSLEERRKEVEEEGHPTQRNNAVNPWVPRRHSWPIQLPSFVMITELDLPWNCYTRVGQGPLHVQIDRLSLHIDFASTATGLLSIWSRPHDFLDGSKVLKAIDIPTDSVLSVRSFQASRKRNNKFYAAAMLTILSVSSQENAGGNRFGTSQLRPASKIAAILLHYPSHKTSVSLCSAPKRGVTTNDDADPKPWQLKHERALALRTNGDLQEATNLLREDAQDLEPSLGSENIETLTAIQYLAVMRLDLGDTDVAATLFQSVLSTAGRVFGEEHAFIRLSMANLASVRARQGKVREAEDLQRHVLKKTQEAVRKTHPDAPPYTHPEILVPKANLANTLRYNGESAESGRLFEDAYNTMAAAFGGDALETVGAMSDYANWLQDQDRVDEAEPLLQKVLRWNQTRHGETHFCTATPRHNLAAAYRSKGRLEDAAVLLRQSYDILHRSEGSHGLEKVVVGNHLSTVIFRLSLNRRDHKRLEEAVRLHETLVAAAYSTLGHEHPLTNNAITEFDRMAEILRKVTK